MRTIRRRMSLGCRTSLGVAAVAAAAVAGTATPATAANVKASHLRTTPVQPFSVNLLPGAVPHSGAVQQSRRARNATHRRRRIDATVYLGLRERSQAKALLREISTPTLANGQANPRYHEYLTPQQFRDRFAPTAATAAMVRTYFEKFGVVAGPLPANNHMFSISGTKSQLEKALGVRLYTGINGNVQTAGRPRLPHNIRVAISDIGGLGSNRALVKPAHIASGMVMPVAAPTAPPPLGGVNGSECSSWWGQKVNTSLPKYEGQAAPDGICGYLPAQLRSAYSLNEGAPANAGKGETVAVVDAYASPSIRNDVNFYSLLNHEPTMSKSQLKEVLMSRNLRNARETWSNDPEGWAVEETLDVEAVHAMAPAANITYVGATSANDAGLQAAETRIIDRRAADIVSNSWGEVEGNAAPVPWNDLFLQADLEGMSMLFSSGDYGAMIDYFGAANVLWPASSPYVTAVGGTSVGIGQDGSNQWETGWGTLAAPLATAHEWGSWGFLFGSGGGTSRVFAQPAYQRGVVPADVATNNLAGTPHRTVPDISMNADPSTGMEIGMTMRYPDGEVGFGEFRIGGTSQAAPLLAGTVALSNNSTGFAHGFLNPAIYDLAGSQYLRDMVAPNPSLASVDWEYNNGYSGKMHAVIDTFANDWGLSVKPGWDNVTGTGAPAPGFIDALGK